MTSEGITNPAFAPEDTKPLDRYSSIRQFSSISKKELSSPRSQISCVCVNAISSKSGPATQAPNKMPACLVDCKAFCVSHEDIVRLTCRTAVQQDPISQIDGTDCVRDPFKSLWTYICRRYLDHLEIYDNCGVIKRLHLLEAVPDFC